MYYSLEILPTTSESASFYTTSQRDNENAGFDLFVPEEVSFQPNEKKLVSMRVKVKMVVHAYDRKEEAVHYWMPPRSSISKTGLILCNSIGVIDASYRGELMAFLWNTTDTAVTVKKGDRLVQIVAPDMGHIQQIKIVNSLDDTQRGEGGFGSSGR
jgi:dUTP pyrophosphatase